MRDRKRAELPPTFDGLGRGVRSQELAAPLDQEGRGLPAQNGWRPGRARVFERLGIDYCCGGKISLEHACATKGLEPAAVAVALEAIDLDDDADEQDWSTAPLSELCDHIVDRHHAYLREELPRLSALVEKVAQAHGDAYEAL